MIKDIEKRLEKIEEKIREKLSHYPILYALIGGIGVVLFWRGIWHMADDMSMASETSFVIGIVILVFTGLFVSEFIGKKLIISGLVGEKELAKKEEKQIKTEEGEIETEETQLRSLQGTLKKLEQKLDDMEKEREKK